MTNYENPKNSKTNNKISLFIIITVCIVILILFTIAILSENTYNNFASIDTIKIYLFNQPLLSGLLQKIISFYCLWPEPIKIIVNAICMFIIIIFNPLCAVLSLITGG